MLSGVLYGHCVSSFVSNDIYRILASFLPLTSVSTLSTDYFFPLFKMMYVHSKVRSSRHTPFSPPPFPVLKVHCSREGFVFQLYLDCSLLCEVVAHKVHVMTWRSRAMKPAIAKKKMFADCEHKKIVTLISKRNGFFRLIAQLPLLEGG